MNIFIPILDKQTLMVMEQMSPCFDQLLLLSFFMAHRSQISMATLGILNKEQLMQLDSSKWSAKQLANHPLLKNFYAKIAIAKTISFEMEVILKMTPEESKLHINSLVESMSDPAFRQPKTGRIISPASLNKDNISAHRHGLVAQMVGIVQAKPIFEPSSIVKNVSISNLSFITFWEMHSIMVQALSVNPVDSTFAQEDGSIPVQPSNEYMKLWLCKQLGWYDENMTMDNMPKFTFNDTVILGNENNLLPLEEVLHVERPFGSVEIKNPEILTEDQMKNPFLVLAAEQQQQQNSLIQQVKKGKSRGPSKTKTDAAFPIAAAGSKKNKKGSSNRPKKNQ